MDNNVDVVIIGAGPIGLACGIEASLRDVSALLIEKGCLANSIFGYPPQMVFFSSPQLLEIGDVPFITAGVKPSRREALEYYRRVSEHFALKIRTYERVDDVQQEGNALFSVRSSRGRVYTSRFVVLATGCYDQPNLLNIPGEDLPKVSHYHKDPHQFYRQKVVVVGGQNSAAEAALDLWHHGAEVTLIHRRSALGDSVKYWLRPDVENRIKDRAIRAVFNARLEKIEAEQVIVRRNTGEVQKIENDFAFLLTGYHADFDFLKRIGIVLDTETLKPLHDPATMETNLPGVYVAGVVCGGRENGRQFIENTRYHAKLIFQDIERKLSVGSGKQEQEDS